MDIRWYQSQDRVRWDQFVETCPDGTLFHTIAWKHVLERVFGYGAKYLWAVEQDHVQAVLPVFLVKKLLRGKALISVPFGVYGGVCGLQKDSEKALIEKAKEVAKELAVDFLELRHSEEKPVPLARKDLYVTFQRKIFPTDEENLNAVPRKQRRMIRQGIKHNLQARVGGEEDLHDFYTVYTQSLRNLGTPAFPFSYFQAIFEAFGERCKILSVWSQNKMVAAVLTFFYKGQVMPYYGGGLPEYFQYAVNDFMYWELMRYGCQLGYQTFDFGRSKRNTGPYRFKEHWGFVPKPLPYQFYLPAGGELPNVSPANPKFKPFIEMWKRCPLPVANIIGPRIVKYFP